MFISITDWKKKESRQISGNRIIMERLTDRIEKKFDMIFFFRVRENTNVPKIDRVEKELGLSRLWRIDAVGPRRHVTVARECVRVRARACVCARRFARGESRSQGLQG